MFCSALLVSSEKLGGCACSSPRSPSGRASASASSPAAGRRIGKRRRVTGLLFVKGEHDRHLHVGVHIATAFAAGLELPLADGGDGGGFEFALRRFDRVRILHVAF